VWPRYHYNDYYIYSFQCSCNGNWIINVQICIEDRSIFIMFSYLSHYTTCNLYHVLCMLMCVHVRIIYLALPNTFTVCVC